MQVLNYGSLNIDYVYRQSHIVRPGETLASRVLSIHAGGKGANQSAALGRAGVRVRHAGCIGADGRWLLELLQEAGVDTSLVHADAAHSGHAIIQVDDDGENAIVLYGGGNLENTPEQIKAAIATCEAGDIVLLQNEINNIPLIMEHAHAHGLRIFFNPAPFEKGVGNYPLHLVSCLILNETEGMGLAGTDHTDAVLETLHQRYPEAEIVLTLGSKGVLFKSTQEQLQIQAQQVAVVDTTAAGDTFIGYYLASLIDGLSTSAALERACCAAALAVSKAGAMESVPAPAEVERLFTGTE